MQLEQTIGDATRSGQMIAWFQPVVRASDWSPIGVEALARWEIEPGSWVSPTEFVPVAEELGLIDDLGVVMLGHAIDAYDTVAPLTRDLAMVSVNLSPIQVQSERLFDELVRIRDEREAARLGGLPPICFEMTEQHVIDDTDVTLARLERLTELDTYLAVDDFGSGYSSLARLNRVPADTLKIDRTLVGQFGTQSGTALLAAVVGVARAYGMQTVAEGVETAEQAMGLRAMGVDHLQGFLFARPAPLDELVERLSSREWMWDVPSSHLQ
jgi:EAL domain-containing protein (putative c-di-GMP-specific phosphodiesterase class I)